MNEGKGGGAGGKRLIKYISLVFYVSCERSQGHKNVNFSFFTILYDYLILCLVKTHLKFNLGVWNFFWKKSYEYACLWVQFVSIMKTKIPDDKIIFNIFFRDYLSVKVWDLHMESKPIETFTVSVFSVFSESRFTF